MWVWMFSVGGGSLVCEFCACGGHYALSVCCVCGVCEPCGCGVWTINVYACAQYVMCVWYETCTEYFV